jgi:hypothetical protein
MNQIIAIIFIIFIFGLLFCTKNQNIKENFHFKHIPIVNNKEACKLRCDNTAGCDTYFFDNVTGQCIQTQIYKFGDIYYPFVNYDYMARPSKYKYKKH